ncbi:hypothetical protein ACLOJK_017061 [Asimina triloba]
MNLGAGLIMYFMVLAVGSGNADYFGGERDALIQLRESLNSSHNLHSNWTGPPCHNNNSRWAGIKCLNSHVVHVVLEGIELTGSLPTTFLQNVTYLSKLSLRNNSLFGPLPSFTNLTSLQFIFLSRNRFSGPIPQEFIDLPNLQRLRLQENGLNGSIPPFNQPTLTDFNVSSNVLEGPIPETPVLLRFPKSSFDNNSELCGKALGKLCPVAPVTPPSPTPSHPVNPEQKKGRTLKIWIIALIAVAALLILSMLVLFFLCCYRRRRSKETKEVEHPDKQTFIWVCVVTTGEQELADRKYRSTAGTDPEKNVELEFFDRSRQIFDLDDLFRASAELMGKGKVGSTYKAMLDSGLVFSVKRLKEMNGLSRKEFVQQMELLGRMKHENLAEIISFYYSKEEKLVIYEYVPGGSLFQLLHGYRGVGRVPVDWARRLAILKGIAAGLAYLHHTLSTHRVPHGNLKSTNVLIHHNDNSNYQPKLTDYGFQALLPPRKAIELLSSGKSPEAMKGKKLTHKADVYCFGLILLEVITGRIPGEFSPGNVSIDYDISEWVRSVVSQDWSTEILDLEIVSQKQEHDNMLKLTKTALECTSTVPEERPTMSEVLRRIEVEEKETQQGERGEREVEIV